MEDDPSFGDAYDFVVIERNNTLVLNVTIPLHAKERYAGLYQKCREIYGTS